MIADQPYLTTPRQGLTAAPGLFSVWLSCCPLPFSARLRPSAPLCGVFCLWACVSLSGNKNGYTGLVERLRAYEGIKEPRQAVNLSGAVWC